MSILSSLQMNVLEAQLRQHYTNAQSMLASLVKINDFWQYAPWIPASDGNVHKSLRATKLGEGKWSHANSGISSTGSKTTLDIENLKLFETESKVDERVLDTALDKKAARDSEDAANFEGFSQSWLENILYNKDTMDGILGLMERRKKLTSKLVWDGGATASSGLTSLLLIEFGTKGMNMIYQPGNPAGIVAKDKGCHRVQAEDGSGEYWAWIRSMKIEAGMCIKNDNALQRLANIDPTGTTFPIATLIKMKNQLPSMGRNAVAFVNRGIKSIIETECYDKSNMAYSLVDIEGFGPVNRIVGINVGMLEAISENETKIA